MLREPRQAHALLHDLPVTKIILKDTHDSFLARGYLLAIFGILRCESVVSEIWLLIYIHHIHHFAFHLL